jgi:hypothetical protein
MTRRVFWWCVCAVATERRGGDAEKPAGTVLLLSLCASDLAPHVLDDSILLVAMILLLLFLGLCQAALNASQQQLDRKLVRCLIFSSRAAAVQVVVVVDRSLRALVCGDTDVARTTA